MDFPKLSDEFRARRLSPPVGRLPLIIDSDAKNEVDDQFAIALLKNPVWVPSKLVPAPTLGPGFEWQPPGAGRHLLRLATYCHRDAVFGDLFHSLAP